MNEKDLQKLQDELSAYLDGEADDPAHIARLIAEDADVARVYAGMQRLSSQVKSLAAPEVHPAFATRVMAHVREAEPVPSAPRHVWRWSLIAVSAAAALFAVTFAPSFFTDPQLAPSDELNGQVAQVLEMRAMPENALLIALESEPMDSETRGGWEDDAESYMNFAQDATLEQEYVDLVATVAALTHDDMPLDDDGDVYEAMESLNDAERGALRQLLSDYAEGGSQLL
ncbi:MAG TPA: hypothetical protein PLJ47_07625 [Candidatus Hydrogenedentes bacterium]|nr:hypothetical protein [Candidatus Hydrogenedentota bacterium]HRK34451.1 hypothetical protein [Candidatus Hydrogenedentota bacterium]